MKVRDWILIGASLGFLVALSVFYALHEWRVAKTQTEAWSQRKYNSDDAVVIELPIEAVGRNFEWRIRYPSRRRLQSDLSLDENFAREANAGQGQVDDLYLVNELHLWKDGMVHLYLKSDDVAHSFFAPVLRLKREVTPGKVTPVWFKMNQSNVAWNAEAADWKSSHEWEFFCAEHFNHDPTPMCGLLFVHETKGDFLKWLKRSEETQLRPPKGK